jgi:hypothetical protein
VGAIREDFMANLFREESKGVLGINRTASKSVSGI